MRAARETWIALLAIAAAAALAYSNCFAGVFVFDDYPNIVDNPFVRRLWPPGPALWANPGLGLHGRPVVALSFAVDHALWGATASGFHATNLAIHALAGCVVFAVARRALRSCERWSFRAHGLALAAALLWTAHPLNSSAVTYVVQRCESLMALLFLLAFYAAQRALAEPAARWIVLAAVAGVLSAGCKEVAAVLPLVVLAYDVGVRGSTLRGALSSRRALYAALLASSITVAALVAWSGGHARSVGIASDIGTWAYLQTQAVALVGYLRLALWPHPLVFDYGWPTPSSPASWLAAGACVLSLLAATALALARHRAIGFAGAWFFLVLAPTSSFLPITTELVAEQRMYLPLAALTAVAACAGHALLARAPRALAIGATCVVTLVLALATRARNRDYHSEERLWRSVVAAAPDNPRAHDSLGDALRRAGRGDEAREHFAEAVRLQPGSAFWRNNYGSSLSAAGDQDGALEQYREAVRLKPDLALARANLGRALYLRGETQEACEHLRAAVRLQPSLAAAYRWAGLALADQGQPALAVQYLRAALQVDANDDEVRRRLEALLASSPGEPRR